MSKENTVAYFVECYKKQAKNCTPSQHVSNLMIEFAKNNVCKACNELNIEISQIPCSHLICWDCYFNYKNCPFCDCEVDGVLELY